MNKYVNDTINDEDTFNKFVGIFILPYIYRLVSRFIVSYKIFDNSYKIIFERNNYARLGQDTGSARLFVSKQPTARSLE